MGADWVRTQWSGGYQCTEFAHRYLHFKWDVEWIPNGNAGEWCDDMPPASSGLVQTMEPVHGDIMVLAPGSCGAGAETGHVNIIDTVDGGGKVTAVEQNQAGRRQYNQSCGKCFLHVVANDGESTGFGRSACRHRRHGQWWHGGMSGASGSGGMSGSGGATVPAGTGGKGGSGGMTSPPVMPQAGAPAQKPAGQAGMAAASTGSGGATAVVGSGGASVPDGFAVERGGGGGLQRRACRCQPHAAGVAPGAARAVGRRARLAKAHARSRGALTRAHLRWRNRCDIASRMPWVRRLRVTLYAFTLGLLCLAQFVAFAHLTLVSHSVCAEHGELVHAGDEHASPGLEGGDSGRGPRSREHSRRAAAGYARSRSLRAAAHRRERALTAAPQVDVAPAFAHALPALAATAVARVARDAVLDMAPKTSPPA